MDADLIVPVWRAVSVTLGIGLLGMLTATWWGYIHNDLTAHLSTRAAVLYAAAFSLAVVSMTGVQIESLVRGDGWHWRLLINPLSYALGLWSLNCVLKEQRRRGR